MDLLVVLGIPIGIVFLYFASDWLVEGAKKLALRLGITPFIVGLTVVAFGSSAPEAITSIVSTHTPELIVGNIVGSNIVNIGLAIGLAAVLKPLVCKYENIRFELICMMISVVAITVLSINGVLGSFEGIVLVLMLFVFVYLVYKVKKDDTDDTEPAVKDRSVSMPKSILSVAVGLIGLFIGAQIFINGSVELAEGLGVSPLLIGLIVVAVGTSLPEMSICIMAAWKGESDLVVSNIVGSIIFNSFFALGIGAILVDIPISDSVLFYHMPLMVIMCLVLFVMVRWKNSVSRPVGAALILMYVVYLGIMIMNPSLTI